MTPSPLVDFVSPVWIVGLGVKLSSQAENETGLYAVLQTRPIHTSKRSMDDVIEVPSSFLVPLHRVEAKLDLFNPTASILLTDDLVHTPLYRCGRALNALGPLVQDAEIVIQPLALVGVYRDHLLELPVVLYRELEPLSVCNGPHDVGSD